MITSETLTVDLKSDGSLIAHIYIHRITKDDIEEGDYEYEVVMIGEHLRGRSASDIGIVVHRDSAGDLSLLRKVIEDTRMT